MSDDDSTTWGTHEPYEQAYALLLANLSPQRLPAPTFWMLEANAQKVRAAVRDLTGLSLDDWDKLSPPERVPWLDRANEALVDPDKGRVVGVLSQSDVASILDKFPTEVARLVDAGELTAIRSGRRVLITLESLEEYRRKQKRVTNK